MTSDTDREAVDWLLGSTEPAIRNLVHRDLLHQPGPDEPAAVRDGPIVRMLLGDQVADGGSGGHPYKKWGGAHWRLVSLVELGIPAGEPRALAALADGPHAARRRRPRARPGHRGPRAPVRLAGRERARRGLPPRHGR